MSTDTDWLEELLALHLNEIKAGHDGKLKAALAEHESQAVRAARLDELDLLADATAPLRDQETWEDWCFRVSDYLQDRIKQLQGDSIHKDRGPGFTHFEGDNCTPTTITVIKGKAETLPDYPDHRTDMEL